MSYPENKIISVLGCGWLGFPLAERLVQTGYHVFGSTTSAEKICQLENCGIHPFLINCQPRARGEHLEQFFSCAVLFINIPFRRNLVNPEEYFHQIQSLIPWIEKTRIPSVIFASSTSIYPEFIGPVEEKDNFIPDNSRAEVLLRTENLLRTHAGFKTAILRFSGLYGPERDIGKFLAGKKAMDGLKPVNLIHLDDCVNIIAEIIKKNLYNETFNLCSDGHPTRKELYTQAAVQKGLLPPEFKNAYNAKKRYKIVLNAKVKDKLAYQFKYPDPLAYISGL